MLLDEIVPLLPHVSKPIQYVGEEVNAVHKPWPEMQVKVGLCFPDTYAVGMSHLGLHILYHSLNANSDVVAERLYAPDVDMEALMRVRNIPLFSLESHRAAADFDLLGFTLQYELSYSNILNMLSLAGIPLLAKDRPDHAPLVIAGGPCSCNPEPLADICELFVIGDGETVISQIIETYKAWKASGAGKQEFLKTVCKLPGIYVPSFYTVHYLESGQVTEILPISPEVPEVIERVIEPDLDAVAYPSAPILPYLKTVHDHLTLEVMRGCPRGCRFCQAGFIYRPQRERSLEHLLVLAKSLLGESGYSEVTLSSLSTGDYSQIVLLMTTMMQTCEALKVALSLPSMRVNTLTGEMAEIIRRVRKTGFTIAPEAGTQRLRDVINKGISEADILQTAEEAFRAGWDLLKLYFMIGLPTETDEDIEGLIDLAYRIQKSGKRLAKRKVKLHLAISSFVPKSHTPFQWDRMNSIDELRRKQEFVKQRVRQRAIQLKWHHVQASYLEGVFARGDRRLGQVLCEAHSLGCKFDGWTEHFNFSKWMEAFTRLKIDPDGYVSREREEQEMLPWDHIHTGISKTFLWKERLKAFHGEGTPPCTRHCRQCGLCHEDLHVIDSASDTTKMSQDTVSSPLDLKPFQQEEGKAVSSPAKSFRVRAMYSKTGLLRFLSHLDLARVFQRAVSRVKAPLAYSQGFHPHPQIAFGPALPVGTEGLREYVDFFFTEAVDVDFFVNTMNNTLPSGVELREAHPVDLKAPSLSSSLKGSTFRVFVSKVLVEEGYTVQYFTHYLQDFFRQDVYLVNKFKKRTEPIDIKPFISVLKLTPGEEGLPCLQMSLRAHLNVMIKPEEVLHQVFDMPYEKVLDCQIIRVSMETEEKLSSPVSSSIQD